MSDNIDGRIDYELRGAGARWRSQRPAPATTVDPTLFADRRPPRPLATFASVIAVVAVAIVAVLIIVSLPPSNHDVATASTSPSPLGTSSPGPTPIPSPSAAPSPTAAPAQAGWQRIGADQLPQIDAFDSVTAADGRFLAKAHRCPTDGGQCEHLLLESFDGISWLVLARITPDSGQDIDFVDDPVFAFLAAADAGYSGSGAGLWQASDGVSWRWLGDQTAFDGSECGSQAHQGTDIGNFYRAGTQQLVVLGRVYCDGSVVNRAWATANGYEWGPVDTIPVTSVVTGHGLFVGLKQLPDGDSIWRSVDGLRWEQVFQAPVGLSLVAVASGFVALGSWPDGRSYLLISPDGTTWTQTESSVAVAGLLASDGSRAVFAEQDSTFASADVWVSSTDGTDWTAYDITGAAGHSVDAAAILGQRVVAVSGKEPMTWVADVAPAQPIATPTPPTASPTPTLPLGTPPPDVVAPWQESTDNGLGAIDEINGFAQRDGTYVITGTAEVPVWSSNHGWMTRPVPGIWYSIDAQHWQPATLPAQPALKPTGVAATDSGFAALGSAGEPDNTTFLLTSADGITWQATSWFQGYATALTALGGTLLAYPIEDYGQTAAWSYANDTWNVAGLPHRVLAATPAGGYLWAVVGDDQTAPQLWRSADAVTWQKVTDLPGAKGLTYGQLAVGPRGWLIVGERVTFSGPDAAHYAWYEWTSPDGQTWGLSDTPPQGANTMTSLLADDQGFVAAGYDTGGCCAWDSEFAQGIIWTSADGVTWQQQPERGWVGRLPDKVTRSGDSLIVLGTDWNLYSGANEVGAGAVWTIDRKLLAGQ